MNYAQYMRKVQAGQSRIIGYNSGQDASMVTLKAQARASSVRPVSVATSFSKAGGSVGNIAEPLQHGATVGVSGVGATTVAFNGSSSVLGSQQNAAVCSDASSAAPYQVVIPCGTYIPPYNGELDYLTNKGILLRKTPCPSTDPSQLYRNNSELVSNKGAQLALRTGYGLPNKLEGLRGAVASQ